MLEYWDQLVVVPRVCEHCLQHLAVYWCDVQWPDTYLCRFCLNTEWYALRLACGLRERSVALAPAPPNISPRP